MKTEKTVLTQEVLNRFEQEKDDSTFTEEICRTAEHAAYVAMLNRHEFAERHNGIWTMDDVYNDFIKIMALHGIAYGSIKYKPVVAE